MGNVLIRPTMFRSGAEELDAEFFEKNLASVLPDLYTFQLGLDSQHLFVRTWNSGKVTEEFSIPMIASRSFRTLLVLTLIGDPACRHFLKLGFADTVNDFLMRNHISIDCVFTSISSLLGVSLAIPAKFKVSRSGNFEPIHYWQENDFSVKKPIVFLLKIWSTFLEVHFSKVLPISPKDSSRYSKLSFGRTFEVLPLQHIQGPFSQSHALPSANLEIGFLGSTYNVKHNRDSFEFIVKELAPRLVSEKIHFNVYGVKAPGIDLPRNVTVHGWKDSIDEIYLDNTVFVVPYFGGTGQQSKLFEPLSKGKLVIADPAAFGGYPFGPEEHYLPAHGAEAFAQRLREVSTDVSNYKDIPEDALRLCEKLFSRERSLASLKIAIHE
jgi:hypothetical protein